MIEPPSPVCRIGASRLSCRYRYLALGTVVDGFSLWLNGRRMGGAGDEEARESLPHGGVALEVDAPGEVDVTSPGENAECEDALTYRRFSFTQACHSHTAQQCMRRVPCSPRYAQDPHTRTDSVSVAVRVTSSWKGDRAGGMPILGTRSRGRQAAPCARPALDPLRAVRHGV